MVHYNIALVEKVFGETEGRGQPGIKGAVCTNEMQEREEMGREGAGSEGVGRGQNQQLGKDRGWAGRHGLNILDGREGIRS